MRLTLLALALALASPGGPARADAETDLYDLVMAWESVGICGFPMPDDAAERLDAAIEQAGAELGKGDAEMQELHDQAAWQILRQKPQMCAADGSWRQRYDQLVATLRGGG